VRQRDAHAWCLVWDYQHHLWRDFDPTPSAWMTAEGQQVSWMQRLSDLWARISFEISKFRWGQSHWRQYLLWTVLPVLVVLLYQIIFRKRRRFWSGQKPSRGENADWPGSDSEFYELERGLAKRGLGRQPHEPLSIWLERIASEPAPLQIHPVLRQLLNLHYRYRFDPRGLSSNEREQLRVQAQQCLAKLEQGFAALSPKPEAALQS